MAESGISAEKILSFYEKDSIVRNAICNARTCLKCLKDWDILKRPRMTPNDLFRVGGHIEQLKMISLFTEITNINDQTKSRKLQLISEIYVLDSVRPRFSLFF